MQEVKSVSSKNAPRHRACEDKGGAAWTENIISLTSRAIVVGCPPPPRQGCSAKIVKARWQLKGSHFKALLKAFSGAGC